MVDRQNGKLGVNLLGAFGGVNVGDEAIALATGNYLNRVFPSRQLRLICLCGGDALRRSKYDRTHALSAHRFDFRRILKWLRTGPLVIGGGQLFNGANFPKGLGYIYLLTCISRAVGQKVIAIGLGCHEIEHGRFSQTLVRRICRNARAIRVRDRSSYNSLVSVGVDERKVELCADVVFTTNVEESGSCLVRDKLYFAVHGSPHVRHHSHVDYAVLVESVCAARNKACATLVCHDNRDAFDVGFAQRVQECCRIECSVNVTRDVATVTKMYQGAELVISSRMHPLILGLMNGAKVLPISGSKKVADLAARMGAKGILDAPFDLATVRDAMNESSGYTLSNIPPGVVDAAQANFAGLERLLC